MSGKYIIFTPGRTKSHMILTYLARYGYHTINIRPPRDTWFNPAHESTYRSKKKIVIHYHGTTFVPKHTEDYTAILNHRKDIFAWHCSHEIARITGNYTEYPDYDKDLKVRIVMEDAVKTCKTGYDHFENVKNNILEGRPWKKIIRIDYEDIGDTYENLFRLLPIEGRYYDYWKETAEKSPYSVEKHIWHYRFVRNQFRKRFYETYGIRF